MITAAKEALSFDQALLVARERARRLGAELVPIAHAAGRRLAEDVRARVNLPGFTGSAMDGYAVQAQDLPGTLRIVGESAAGAAWGGRLGRGEAVRISTGGAMPDGADAVVRLEDAREQDGALSVDPSDRAWAGRARARGGHPAGAGVARRRGDRRPPRRRGNRRRRPRRRSLRPPPPRGDPRQRQRARATGSGAAGLRRVRLEPPRARRSGARGRRPGRRPKRRSPTTRGHSGRHRAPPERGRWRAPRPPGHGRRHLARTPRPPAGSSRRGRGRRGLLRPRRRALPADLAGPTRRPAGPGPTRESRLSRCGLPRARASPAWGRRRLGAPGAPGCPAPAGHDRAVPAIMLCEEGGALRPLPEQGSHAVTSLAKATALALIEADRDQVGAGEKVRFSSLP